MTRLLTAATLLAALALPLRAHPQPAQPPPTTPPPPLPTLTVTQDNTLIRESCRVLIPKGTVIADLDGDGVLQIAAPDITVEFAPGSLLRGWPDGDTPDRYAGVGIRIDGHKNVTIKNAALSGFKVGLWATSADALTLDDCRAADLWRPRLRSTREAEDPADWLWPHNNDAGQWRTNYGAAFAVERSSAVTIRVCSARKAQNGLLLDRVSASTIVDNDFSFLSGWGLALWRSSNNLVSRNALDFCIRGYSHTVYNRGQDSAGILCFEQSSNNTFIENSATHGGDGFFGFAGNEALATNQPGTGCNNNLLIQNDFSYAAAHGIELTFSFDNRFHKNRLVENAICGVWAGYSRRTLIDENTLTGNGLPGNREGGGINIEHGRENTIAANTFEANTVGVALWANPNDTLEQTPWAKANATGSAKNRIERNAFTRDTTAIRLRNSGTTGLTMNTFDAVANETDADDASPHQPFHLIANEFPRITATPVGSTRPVGARPDLRGRHNIIMTPWGPWDHQSPLALHDTSRELLHTLRLYKLPDGELDLRLIASDAATMQVSIPDADDRAKDPRLIDAAVFSETPGLHPYTIRVSIGDYRDDLRGVLLNCAWQARVFPFTIDPRTDLEAWRAESEGPAAVAFEPESLRLRFANGGPSDLGKAVGDAVVAAKLPRDRFGTIARTIIPLTSGRYRIVTKSDDGIRVRVRTQGMLGEEPVTTTVIENWTHHGPTTDTGEFSIGLPGFLSLEPCEIIVEHFELDGYALIEFSIEPA